MSMPVYTDSMIWVSSNGYQ